MNYHVARNGQQLGVLSSTDISLKLSSGELSSEDLAWTEGMASWQPISSIGGLSAGSSPEPVGINPYAAPQSDIFHRRNAVVTTELASLGERLGAHLLNVLTIIPAIVLAGIGSAFEDSDTHALSNAGVVITVSAGFYLIGLLVYNMVRVATHGQSLGKQWMGIRIVDFEHNCNAGFARAVLLRSVVNFIISFVVPFYGLVDTLFVFREDRRCLHDLIAGTHVVKN